MPRKRIVTRSIKVTKMACEVVDVTSHAFEKFEVVIPKFYKDVNKLITKAQEKIGTEKKIINVSSVTPTVIRYGMYEEDFVNSDKVMILGEKADEKEDEESEEE